MIIFISYEKGYGYMRYCSKCGQELPDEAKFCGGCGSALTGQGYPVPNPPNNQDEPGKKRIQAVIAGVLVFLLLIAGYLVFHSIIREDAFLRPHSSSSQMGGNQ